MKKLFVFIISISFITYNYGQNKGHYNLSKFKQLNEELPTPNNQHTASGAPGFEYTHQRVDYKMDIILDDNQQKIFGKETITYHNNSTDNLDYLWVQLDQNLRSSNTKSPDISSEKFATSYQPSSFTSKFKKKAFDGGFKIEYVKDEKGSPIKYIINGTMMRINLAHQIKSGEKFVFTIKWWYNINDYIIDEGRSGFEPFPDGNKIYIIAQFYPRLAKYNNVEGWQNLQFWGDSEYGLEFGNFDVSITTPTYFMLNGTGTLQNPKEVFSEKQYHRYQKAKKSFEKPIIIVTSEEALKAEKSRSTTTKTWSLKAENVRDFAFATSRKFIWDGMAVDINGKTVMAYSLYPKEGNPLWEETSTRTVAHTLKFYSNYTFNYPYPQATSIHAKDQAMEYPMICWNQGRPNSTGEYSERTKNKMMQIITHEVGHNFFPMIVNSDERQWTWMDEGINTFIEMLSKHHLDSIRYPLKNIPKTITSYMSGDQNKISPIMTQGDNIFNFYTNAYKKPATGLLILRNTIMGPELFDYAFKTYANRWKFKHPTPADFFRTMEDASAMDLDWFWRGWFYTTATVDIGIKEVKKYYVTDKPSQKAKNLAKKYGVSINQLPPSLYLISETSDEFNNKIKTSKPKDHKILKNYIDKNFSSEEKRTFKTPNYFYEIIFEKPGDLVMPIIVEFEYEDGTKKRKQFPAQIWRKNDTEVSKIFTSEKQITKITIDPDEETADINTSNNYWPKTLKSSFDKFKLKQIKN